MDNKIKELHHRLALLMHEIHKICIENDIKYTMIGGTLIGAIRHKGFIPWDDDIDIGMTLDNYIKFKNIVFNKKYDWIDFDLAGITKNYFCTYIKAYDTRTMFIENGVKISRGLFVDIFPIVKAGDTKLEALYEFAKHKYYQSILKRKSQAYNTFFVKELFLKFLSKSYETDKLMILIDLHYSIIDKKYKKYSSDMDGTKRGIVLTQLFDEYCLYKFEQYEFMGIKRADEYLKKVFGDYMKLPPEEKRVPNHLIYLDLDLSYKKYSL
ncbi:LicD family protein [Xylanibacter oryzae]|uniref:LicD family protein n=1 Tax=Xylanibacter oryzae TaxID=185293 RepID=UPI0004B772D0|nr:LicD family protein [Xylanibacter oryzae]